MSTGDRRPQGPRPGRPESTGANADASSAVLEDAVVLACLPQALFKVRIGDRQVTASLSVDALRYGLAPIVGDRVRVRRSPLDPGRGVIVERSPNT